MERLSDAELVEAEAFCSSEDEANALIRRLIAEVRASRKPGWVLVPKEPTHEMICAGDGQDRGFGSISAKVYRAMLSALPSPPVGE